MKNSISKISIIIFLLIPFFANADMPGNHMHVGTAFEITNTKDFGKYTFYYKQWGDSIKIKENKLYEFGHGGNPNMDWNILIFAVNDSTGKSTAPIDINQNGTKYIITVTGIQNDSIQYTLKEENYEGETNLTVTPTDDPNGNITVVTKMSTLTYLLLGISIVSVLTFGLLIFLRMKKA